MFSGCAFRGCRFDLLKANLGYGAVWDACSLTFSFFAVFGPLPSRLGATCRVAVISAKNHKRQRRKRQSVTAKREKSQTPKDLIAILTLPNLT